MEALVGVDSGGTRTNVLIRSNGQDITYELDESLSGSLSPEKYAQTLLHILRPVEAYIDSNLENASIFISAAGFAPGFRDDFLAAMTEVVPDLMSGKVTVAAIANDAPTLLLGHEANAVVIAGTGSNVLVQPNDGDLFQVGGHEWVASDYGSGFWIGLRGIRRAYRDLESDSKTVLLQRLMQEYGVRAGDSRRLIAKFRDLAIADAHMKPEIARFAASVCAAAERGDAPAQDIVKTEAEDLADVLAGALRRRFTQEELARGIRIVDCGGLLSNQFYSLAFRSQVEMRLRTVGHEAQIAWTHTSTGIDAALELAGSVRDEERDFMSLPIQFRPLVVRFG